MFFRLLSQNLPQETEEEIIVALLEKSEHLMKYYLPLSQVNSSKDAMFGVLLKMVANNQSALSPNAKETTIKYFD